MKVFSVILLLGAVATCHGYSYLIPANMDQPGMCYFNGHALPRGETQMPTACQSLRCNDDGSILVQGCGRLNLQNCTLLGPTKNAVAYPDCCEMNYQCKDREGRLYMRQWNQLKGKRDRRDQDQEQNSEAIYAAQELLDQIRQQAQRDGRREQRDSAENVMLDLRQIREQQAQQEDRRGLGQPEREDQDLERSLLQMSMKMAKLLMEDRSYDELKRTQEAISDLVRAEIQRQDRPESAELRAQLIRVKEELQILDQIKARQAQESQQRILNQAEQQQQEQQLKMQRGRVAMELMSLMQIWTRKMEQISQNRRDGQFEQEIRAILSLVEEKIRKQGRLQSSELRAQLNRVEEKLQILDQIEARQVRDGQQETLVQEQQEKEIRMQRERVMIELKRFIQIWVEEMGQAGQGRKSRQSEPEVRAILSLVEENLQRQGRLQSADLRDQLNRFERELQTLAQIKARQAREEQQGTLTLAQQLQQKQEIKLQRERVAAELMSLVKIWVQRMGQADQGRQDWQSEEEVRDFLSLVQEKIKRLGRLQSRELRAQLNRVEEEFQILAQIRARQAREFQQGSLSQAQREQEEQEIRMQLKRVEAELRALMQEWAQRMGQVGQDKQGRQSEEEIRGILNLIREQIQGRGGLQSLELRAQLNRVEEELQILAQIRARQVRDSQQGSLSQAQREQDEQEIRMQLKRVEAELRTLMQEWAQRMGQVGQEKQGRQSEEEIRGILNLIREQIQGRGGLQSLELRAQLNRVEEELQILAQIRARLVRDSQQGSLTQAQREQEEQEIRMQLKRVEAELRTLMQEWAQRMGQGGQGRQDRQGRQSEEEVRGILSLVREKIQRQGRPQSSELSDQLNRVEEELQVFDQIEARQARDGRRGPLNQAEQQQKGQEVEMQRRRVEKEIRELMQMWPRGMGQARLGSRGGLSEEQAEQARTIDLAALQIPRQEQLQSSELRSQINRVEKELQILNEIRARREREAQQKILTQAEKQQQEQEIQMQRRRVEKELRDLMQLWAERMGQTDQNGQGGQFKEDVRSILSFVREQILRQGRRQSLELRAQITRVEGELRILDQIRARQADQGILTQSQQKEELRMQRLQVGKELNSLMEMLVQEVNRDGQGGLLEQNDQIKMRQVQRKALKQAEKEQKQQEKRLQREGLEKDVKTLLEMLPEQSEQQQGVMNFMRVKLLKSETLESEEVKAQRERLEKDLQTLVQLKAQQSQVSKAARPEYEQRIKMQRERIESELRALMEIRAKEAAKEGRGLSVREMDGKVKIEQEELSDEAQAFKEDRRQE